VGMRPMIHLRDDTPIQFAVTTSKLAPSTVIAKARDFSVISGCPYIPRHKQAIRRIIADSGMGGAIVFEMDGMVVRVADDVYRFHPNMAKIRITSLLKGGRDQMADAMQLKSGDFVLDCTCGMGSDAIVASYVVGEAGNVCALETSSLLASIVHRGLQSYSLPLVPIITEAMRRIKVRHAASDEVLADLPAKSWDVVYFDPMFASTIDESKGLGLVRLLGQPGAPSSNTIHEAVRVARRSVVMKDRWPGDVLQKIGFRLVSRSERTCFGVIDDWS